MTKAILISSYGVYFLIGLSIAFIAGIAAACSAFFLLIVGLIVGMVVCITRKVRSARRVRRDLHGSSHMPSNATSSDTIERRSSPIPTSGAPRSHESSAYQTTNSSPHGEPALIPQDDHSGQLN